MDGNRRFARKRSAATLDGHAAGYEKLIQILEWSLELGVKACSVFAFSIENFRRPEVEVNGLMDLAHEKFSSMLNPTSEAYRVIMKHKVKIRILGDCSLLPVKVQVIMKKVVEKTKEHEGVLLNICMSYTAQQEIKQVQQAIHQGISSGILDSADVSQHLLERCLYTCDCPPIDLLLRTSGETRLSDFLLYQTHLGTQFDFISPYWPELNFWRFGLSVWKFQYFASASKAERENAGIEEEKRQYNCDKERAVEQLKQMGEKIEEENVEKLIEQLQKEREERINEFLKNRQSNAIM
jgi:ditrans,polycis-polyprenyl diphosphate synthase